MGTQKVTEPLIFAISIDKIDSPVWLFSVISAPETIIKDFLNYSLEERLEDSHSGVASLWSLSVAIFSISGMIGSFSTGLFVNSFGRHNSVLLVNLLIVTGGCLMGFSKLAESVEMPVLGQ